jgi:hypothetical protein
MSELEKPIVTRRRHTHADLPPDVKEALHLLRNVPAGVVEPTLALLPACSRKTLARAGLVESLPADVAVAAEITVTPLGWREIAG